MRTRSRIRERQPAAAWSIARRLAHPVIISIVVLPPVAPILGARAAKTNEHRQQDHDRTDVRKGAD